ncbi:nuclear transport factor 2 family protein [Chondrinema litorale]|uniref:nuclear transport factor 2 family protein n=1 Tax=Chondrinema litorale TaxID=2994555 RepID=UPI0025429180|nr:nuclear transport factor 2 family protein [Chondrinema litorale]UZR94595.1 nuclear transport factor 2 family protein [Chondrinema litorale]
MVKVSMDADCGNSPKVAFLKTLNIAFAEGNVALISDSVTENIVWNMIGDKSIEGKPDFVKTLEAMKATKTKELVLKSIVTHGKEGATNGEMILENGEKYAFCDVYEFSNAKGSAIKTITSYVIEIKSK